MPNENAKEVTGEKTIEIKNIKKSGKALLLNTARTARNVITRRIVIEISWKVKGDGV
jgi:hypothetical protein